MKNKSKKKTTTDFQIHLEIKGNEIKRNRLEIETIIQYGWNEFKMSDEQYVAVADSCWFKNA